MPPTLHLRPFEHLFAIRGSIRLRLLPITRCFPWSPLLYLLLAVAGVVGNTGTTKRFIQSQLTVVAPWAQEILASHLGRFMRLAPRLGWLSLGFILWFSGLFFAVLQNSLLLPWAHELEHKKGVWRAILPWLLGPALGFLLTLAMISMHLLGYIPLDWLPFKISPAFWSWIVLSLLVLLLYRLLLPLYAPFCVIAAISFLISGVSQLLTTVFAHFISRLPGYAMVYGSLASLVLFLLWLAWNMAIILWGGHFIRVWCATFHLGDGSREV